MTAGSVILLAEDNCLDAMLLAGAFRKSHIESRLRVVGDGELVVKYLKGEGPYEDRAQFPMPWLMLLDVRMPIMGGLEVLKWKQEQREFCGLPVVVIGDSMPPEWVLQAYEHGASCVVSKGADLCEFAEELKKIIDCFFRMIFGSEKNEGQISVRG